MCILFDTLAVHALHFLRLPENGPISSMVDMVDNGHVDEGEGRELVFSGKSFVIHVRRT